MKLGVFTCLLSQKNLDEVLNYLSASGVQTIELATGGYVGSAHANPEELLQSKVQLENLKELVKKYDMEISALSCHANPVHPNRTEADMFHKAVENTVLLAEKLGVSRVITFSGCPGDSPSSVYPNWVTCPWPEDFQKILEYQWNDVLIPYWTKMAKFCENHGVDKISLEMHPGFCVYNPETLLKLRSSVGDTIGANYDPSHLFWQGMDPVASIRKLGPAIFHFHAKDCRVDAANTALNGVLDTKHYSDVINRSWVFRTIGYGHDYSIWKDIISNLRMIGYDYVISIEHEDSLLSANEGLQKAISFLKEVMVFEDREKMWWA